MGEYKFKEVLLELLRGTDTSNGSLARFVGVQKPTVAGWINGRDPSFKYVIKVAEFFNVSFDELAGIEPINRDRMAEIREYRKSIEPNTHRVEYHSYRDEVI